MKKTRITAFRKTVTGSLVSFLSLFLFVMLAVSIFTGLKWSGEAFLRSTDKEFDTYGFHDFQAQFPLGFSEEDIEALKGLEGVSRVEGSIVDYRSFSYAGRRLQARLGTTTEETDRFSLIEGTLPSLPDEIAVERNFALGVGLSVGDVITFSEDTKNIGEILRGYLPEDIASALGSAVGNGGLFRLRGDTFRVTALIETPAYISRFPINYGVSPYEGTPIHCLMYLSPSAFASRVPGIYCSELVITSDTLRGLSSVSDEYRSRAAALGDSIHDFLRDRIIDPAKTFLERARGTVDDRILDTALNEPRELADRCITVLDRQGNSGLTAANVLAETLSNLARTLSLTFIIVSLFVCYAAISRMVYDDARVIGMKKALGFTPGEIARPYLLFGGLASTLGCLAGFFMGEYLIQRIFLSVIRNTFLLQSTVFVGYAVDVLSVSVPLVLLVTGTALLASFRTVRKDTLALLAGAPPVSGKTRFFERFPLWRRFPLFIKTVFNNALNDRRRLIESILGIAGCTTLLVSAVYFNANISDCLPIQFEKLQSFDTVFFVADGSEEDLAAAEEVLADIPHARVYSPIGALKTPEGMLYPSYIFVGEADDLDRMFHLYDLDGNLHSASEGCFINASFAVTYGIEAGGSVVYTDATNHDHTLPVAGVSEYYIPRNQVILTYDAYRDIVGTTPVPNAYLANVGDADIEELEARLAEIGSYRVTERYLELSAEGFHAMSDVSLIVAVVYFVLSVFMAVFVVLNLVQMFVREKKNELITMMINGYSVFGTVLYILVDVLFVSAIGVIIGTVLGCFIGRLSVDSVSTNSSFFLQGFNAEGCFTGAGISALLVIAVSAIPLLRIPRLTLSDINRAA